MYLHEAWRHTHLAGFLFISYLLCCLFPPVSMFLTVPLVSLCPLVTLFHDAHDITAPRLLRLPINGLALPGTAPHPRDPAQPPGP